MKKLMIARRLSAGLAGLLLTAGLPAADDVPVVAFAEATTTATEGDTVKIKVVKKGSPAASVDYGPYGSSDSCSDPAVRATPNEDYVPVSGTLHFPEGAATKTISVKTNKDKVADAGEIFCLQLAAPTSGPAVSLGFFRFNAVHILWE